MFREKIFEEKFGQKFFGRIFDHFDFFDDYAALAPHFFFFKTRIGQHIGDQIKGLGDLFINDFDQKSGFFVRRKSVEISAEFVGFNGNIERRAFCRSLKNGVFDKMANSV